MEPGLGPQWSKGPKWREGNTGDQATTPSMQEAGYLDSEGTLHDRPPAIPGP